MMGILAAALLLTGCDFEHYEVLPLSGTLDVTPRELTAGSALMSVQVTSSGDWLIIAPPQLTVQPLYGSGDREVLVRVTEEGDEDYTFYVLGTDVTLPVVVRHGGDATQD